MNIIIVLFIAVALFAMVFSAIACCVISGRCSRMEEEVKLFESSDSGDNGIEEVD